MDICAGSGIGSAIWKALGGRTVCYVEKDPYCQQLLQSRIRDGAICDAPIWGDLKTFDGKPWNGVVDFIFGGIPCQPHSLAGKRQGEFDDRNLWPNFKRIISEVGPKFVLVENVSGFIIPKRGCWRERTFEYKNGERTIRWWQKSQQAAIGRVCGELAEIGYDAEWMSIPASAVQAPHQRWRVWLVAYPQNLADAYDGRRTQYKREGQTGGIYEPDKGCQGHNISNAEGIGMEGNWASGEQISKVQNGEKIFRCNDTKLGIWGEANGGENPSFEPGLGGFINGLADGVEFNWWHEGWDEGIPKLKETEYRRKRLMVAGNGWVPQVAIIPMVRVAQLLAGIQC